MALTDNEIVELIKTHHQEKNSNMKRSIEEIIIEENKGLVVSIASSYLNHGLYMDDLIQEGYIGLIKAINNFDTTKEKAKFSTYAYRVIKSYISRAIQNQGQIMTLPERVKKDLNDILDAEISLEKTLGRRPLDEEVSEYLSISVDKLSELRNYAVSISSLEDKFGDYKNYTLLDIVKSLENNPEENLSEVVLEENLALSLDALGEKEREIIDLSFGINGKNKTSINDIAKRFGVSKERIRQIQKVSYKKIKELMEKDNEN